jgi:hypothetical protein
MPSLVLDYGQLITADQYLVSLSGILEPAWQNNQNYFHWQSCGLFYYLPVETQLWNATFGNNAIPPETYIEIFQNQLEGW